MKRRAAAARTRRPRSRPDPEIARLLAFLDEAYVRKAWHGPNLRGALRGVSARDAAWRPAPGRHNVWELALHAAYWKYAVRRRLTGERRGAFPAKGSNWFARGSAAGEKRWRGDLALLEREHRALREVVAAWRSQALGTHPSGSRYTAAEMIAGVAAHDVYHAGQIQLVKALRRNRRGL
jgi:uncharacterized damage-inducible protein DinB